MFVSNLHIKIFNNIFLTFFLLTIMFVNVANGQDTEVVAKKGDGIYRLLTRHGLSVSDYSDSFIELNKQNLGKENSLIAGVIYKLPTVKETKKIEAPAKAKGKTKHFDIFGEK